MQIDLLQLMKEFYEAHGIRILFLSEPYEHLEQTDYGLREQLFIQYSYSDLRHILQKVLKPGINYLFEDDFYLWHTIFILPQELQREYDMQVVCIGPMMPQAMTSGTFQSLMEEKRIPPDIYPQIKEFYNRIPQVSFDDWTASAAMFLSHLAGTSVESAIIWKNDMEAQKPLQTNYAIPVDPTLAMKALEERYMMEEEMLDAVSRGKTEAALAAHIKFRQHKLSPRSPDPMRNTKNMLFVLNTLLRKAAQKGRVHPLHIDTLSTQLAIQIESCSNLPTLESLSSTMVRRYCLLVKNYSRNAYSALIQTCLDYIDFHYMEDLSLDNIAKICSVSNSYLSSLFKKEVSMTLTDYVNSTRVRQALILLNSTNLSIQEISGRCGFSDPNYFTRTFKKFQGQSPKEYRETIRKGMPPKLESQSAGSHQI